MRIAGVLTVCAVALALLAAHFYRGSHWLLAVGSVTALTLLLLRRPWARRALQLLLLLGTLEWLRTAMLIGQLRLDQGRPYLRMALILGTVAMLTGAGAWLLQRGTARRYFAGQPN
jgi:hypothetical protein